MQHLLHLSKDRRLKQLIDRHTEPLSLTRQKDIVFYLCASIMSQQLSTKVAHTIRQRFLDFSTAGRPHRKRYWLFHRQRYARSDCLMQRSAMC
jgi:DNA-3-methyladenine glycosylase II